MKHQGQQLFIESRARPLPRPRIPGELVVVWVWVRSETAGLLIFTPTQRSFLLFFFLLGPAIDTVKTKTLYCQSQDPELEADPVLVQAPAAVAPVEAERKEASSCSYQQINCLDSILR